jgi:DNA-binding SARP family transcriptional activator
MPRVYVCGRLAIEARDFLVREDDLPGRQGRVLWTYLVLRRRWPVGRMDLAEAIWGDDIPDAWDTSLSALASRLRRTLAPLGSGEQAITIRGEQGRYALRLPATAFVDWERARDAIHEADRQVFLGNPGAALAEARVAMEIAARGFLPGENAAWILGQRDVLHDIHLRACERTVEAELARGNASIAETEARQLLALDPLREASYRWLMSALMSGGNAVQAAQVYAACRQELQSRTGMHPSAETERLYAEIRNQA